MKTKNRLYLWYLRSFPFGFGKERGVRELDLSNIPDPVVFRSRLGMRFKLSLDDYTERKIFLYDIIERNTVMNLLKFCRTDMTFVDCVANVGFYSLLLAEKLQGGTIHAFEPVAETYRKLTNNVALNGYTNVICNHSGLYDKECTMEMGVRPGHMGASSLLGGSASVRQQVKLTTLDAYCQNQSIEKVDILKIDVEGAERSVMDGARKMLERSEKMIVVIEMLTGRRGGNSDAAAHDSFRLMRELGFQAFFPKGWPYRLASAPGLPSHYSDNLIFLKGY